jgi:hypothetical protein
MIISHKDHLVLDLQSTPSLIFFLTPYKLQGVKGGLLLTVPFVVA